MVVAAPTQMLAQATHATTASAVRFTPAAVAIKPRMMILPFTRDGEDVRTVLEADFNRQVALATLKKAFEAKGIDLVDFQGALQASKRDAALGALSERDFRDRLLENNKADVYITVNYRTTVSSGLTSVAVILESYLTANGMSLASALPRSRPNRLADVSQHIELAIEEMGEEFVGSINSKFQSYETKGIPLAITVRIAGGSSTRLSQKPAGKSETIASLIDQWTEQTAMKGGVDVGTETETLLQFNEFRMPPRDANGATLSARRVGAKLAAYIESLGVTATSTITNGAIYIDIR